MKNYKSSKTITLDEDILNQLRKIENVSEFINKVLQDHFYRTPKQKLEREHDILIDEIQERIARLKTINEQLGLPTEGAIKI
jgi:hypothetical protein